MEIRNVSQNQRNEIKEIYLEVFPKAERKPFLTVRHSMKAKTAQLPATAGSRVLQGFAMVIPYGDLVIKPAA